MEEKQQKPKKKRRFLRRIIVFLVLLVAVLGAVSAVVFRDSLNLDSIKRWFHYRSLVLSDSGQAESFLYGGDLSDTFAILDGDLLVCSPNNISLYSGSGTCYVDQSVTMDTPVVDTNGSLAVVYDAGGCSLYILGQRELIWSAADLQDILSDGSERSDSFAILSARLNRSGQLTVVTQSGGYRGVVTLFDSSYQRMVDVNLSSAYVMDAALSDNGRDLAIVTIGQDNGAFATTLSLYALNTTAAGAFTPDHTLSLGACVVLDTNYTSTEVWALGNRGLDIVTGDGSATHVDWSDRYLKRYTLSGDGLAVALLGKYRAGSQAELWVVDQQGQCNTLELNEQVLAVSAAGRYIAVLTGDRLDIYTADLTLYSSLDGTQGARNVLLMSDGSAILISAESAGFYVP